MKKLDYKKWFLVSLLIWFVSSLWTMITCGWLFNWLYFIPPLIWRTPEQIMSNASMIGSNLVTFIGAMIFVWFFLLIKKQLPYSKWKRGIVYGTLFWIIGPLIGFASLPFFMTIAIQMIVYWLISFLIKYMILGAIVGAFYK